MIPDLMAGGAAGGADFAQFLPILLMLGVVVFFTMRSQKKKEAQHKAMLAALKIGDTVATQSGFVGKIASFVDDQELILTLAPGVDVRFMRAMLSGPINKKVTKQLKGFEKTSEPVKKVQKKMGATSSKRKAAR